MKTKITTYYIYIEPVTDYNKAWNVQLPVTVNHPIKLGVDDNGMAQYKVDRGWAVTEKVVVDSYVPDQPMGWFYADAKGRVTDWAGCVKPDDVKLVKACGTTQLHG